MRENQKLHLIASEIETEEQAASYDRWFRAQVQAAIDDPRPEISHEEAMARLHATIDIARKNAANEGGL